MRIWMIVLLMVVLNVLAYTSHYAGWTCEHIPWSKGCWGDEPVWSVIHGD